MSFFLIQQLRFRYDDYDSFSFYELMTFHEVAILYSSRRSLANDINII